MFPKQYIKCMITASQVMTASQRAVIENESVEFFTQVINCHPINQHQFAQVLCEVIRGSGLNMPGQCAIYMMTVLKITLI